MRLGLLGYSHVAAGLGGVVIGALAIVEASGYPLGSATRMGPGYFPLALGALTILLSLGVLFLEGRGISSPDIPRPAWRGLLWVLLAIAAFALLVERWGLAPAAIASILLSAQADDDLTLKESLILAVSVAAVSVAIFIYLLGLPLQSVAW